MSGSKSHAVQAALATVRRLCRPAPLLLAMLARAERVDAASARDMLDIDPSARLAPLLAPQASAAAARQPGRSGPLAGAGTVWPVAGHALHGPATAPRARADAAPAPGRRRVSPQLPATAVAPELAARNNAALRHPGPATPAEAAQAARDAVPRRELLAAARDRLRRQGGAALSGGARSERTALISGEPHALAARGAAPEAAVNSAASAARALTATAPAGLAGHGLEIPPPAATPAHDPGLPETLPPPAREAPATLPPPAASNAAPEPGPAPAHGAGSVSVPELDIGAAAAPPAPGARPAGPVLDDGATALREEAYRHGVDVT